MCPPFSPRRVSRWKGRQARNKQWRRLQTDMTQSKQFCSFFLKGLLFGVELEGVQEVYVPLEMTRIPLAPAVVSGLINLRGQLVTAVDLRRHLQLEPREEGAQSMNVVVRAADGAVSLLVDEI